MHRADSFTFTSGPLEPLDLVAQTLEFALHSLQTGFCSLQLTSRIARIQSRHLALRKLLNLDRPLIMILGLASPKLQGKFRL